MRRRLMILIPILALLAALPAAAGEAAATFERFKGLAGQWQGSNERGNAVEIEFEVVSGGTAVLERLAIHGEHPHGMVTLYHLDGDDLVLTHYCEAGNQPRMKATRFDGNKVGFDFVDATGLASPDDGHMHSAVMELGEGTFAAAWSWREDGEEQFQEVIRLERAKVAAK